MSNKTTKRNYWNKMKRRFRLSKKRYQDKNPKPEQACGFVAHTQPTTPVDSQIPGDVDGKQETE